MSGSFGSIFFNLNSFPIFLGCISKIKRWTYTWA
jgi:hypothetical protein